MSPGSPGALGSPGGWGGATGERETKKRPVPKPGPVSWTAGVYLARRADVTSLQKLTERKWAKCFYPHGRVYPKLDEILKARGL